jgi:sec-independent protein translocase protein TatC
VTAPPAISDPASKEPVDEVEASRAPLMDHLVELRSRLVICVVAVVVFGLAAFFLAQPILEFLLEPFSEAARRAGREVSEAYFTAPLELLFLKLKLAVLLGLAFAFPVIAFQVWRFVAPGLYKNERGAVAPFLMAIPFLFVAGGAIVYFVLLPLVMGFSFGQEFSGGATKVTYLPKVAEYYSLAIALFGAFGMAFQLPVVLAILGKAEIVSAKGLRKGRKYAIVGIFAVAMVMTPPDIFSQTVLALPVWGLYEASILAVWLIEHGRKRREAEEAKREAEEARREAEETQRRAATAAQTSGQAGLPAGE